MDEYRSPHCTQFPPRQDGAVGIFVAVALSAALLCTVLALDTGRLYWEGQELQRLADMAAMDAANGSTSLSSGVELDSAAKNELLTLAQASVTENLQNSGWEVTTVAEQHGIVPAAPGGARSSCRIADCPPSVSTYSAVNVTVTRETCASIIVSLAALLRNDDTPSATENCLTPATAPLSRSATASKPMFAAFSAGTTLLTLCTNDDNPQLLQTVLNQLLGTGLCAAIVGQAGIADLGISLLELRDGLALLRPDLALGSPQELLDTRVTVAELMEASLNVLEASNPTALAALLNTEEIRLGDLLSIDPNYVNSAAALATKIGVSDLISAGVLLANQQCVAGTGCYSNGIPVSVNLGLASLSVDIGLIQAPVIAIGPIGCTNGSPARGCTQWRTEARPAQLSVAGAVEVTVPLVLKLSLDLDVVAAGARAGITSATRLPGGQPGDTPTYDLLVGTVLSPLSMNTSGALTIQAVNLLKEIPLLGPLLGGVLNILLGDSLTPKEPNKPLHINLSPVHIAVPPSDQFYEWPADDPATFKTEELALELLQSVDTTNVDFIEKKCLTFLICSTNPKQTPVGTLLSSIDTIQKPLIEIISQQLFPVFEALGISLNETEVKILDISTGGSATLVI